jgi:hypothetical protein
MVEGGLYVTPSGSGFRNWKNNKTRTRARNNQGAKAPEQILVVMVMNQSESS